jgi:hypothetical protein
MIGRSAGTVAPLGRYRADAAPAYVEVARREGRCRRRGRARADHGPAFTNARLGGHGRPLDRLLRRHRSKVARCLSMTPLRHDPGLKPIGGVSAVTAAASHSSPGLTPDQQKSRPDDLEHWVTDLRDKLSDDAADWLTAGNDTDAPDSGSSAAPSTTDDHLGPDSRTTPRSLVPDGSSSVDPPAPPAGRHRAAD